jgi:hypothetical protein
LLDQTLVSAALFGVPRSQLADRVHDAPGRIAGAHASALRCTPMVFALIHNATKGDNPCTLIR